MEFLKKIFISLFNKITFPLKQIKLKSLGGISFYEVIELYFTGLIRGDVTLRAASSAFSLTMAIFPFSIFLISLLLNVKYLENTFWELLRKVIPPNTYDTVHDYFTNEILFDRNFTFASLTSFSFILTLLVAANGVNSLSSNMNVSYHTVIKKSFIKKYLGSLGVTIMSIILLMVTLYAQFEWESFRQNYKVNTNYFNETFFTTGYYMRYLLVFAYLVLFLTFLYWVNLSSKSKLKTIFFGAFISTILMTLSTLGFGVYATKFASYNKLYGSIGTMLLMMFWIYINCIVILVGYELILAINSAKKEKIS